MNRRFELVDKRFEELLHRHDRQFLCLIGFIAPCTGLALAAARLF